MWSDSCEEQRKNIKLVLHMKAMQDSHSTLEIINIKLLVPGQSLLPNDDDFGDIECALKLQSRLYTTPHTT